MPISTLRCKICGWKRFSSDGAAVTNDGQSLQGWGFVTPALLWTIAFFVVPFLVMGAMSLATLEGRTLIWGVSLSNYAEIAEKAYIWRAFLVSLEITLTVTVVSVLLAYPLAWIIEIGRAHV